MQLSVFDLQEKKRPKANFTSVFSGLENVT